MITIIGEAKIIKTYNGGIVVVVTLTKNMDNKLTGQVNNLPQSANEDWTHMWTEDVNRFVLIFEDKFYA